jgi:hypothetical protein
VARAVDLHARRRLRLEVEPPRRRAVVPGIAADHDEAAAVGHVEQRLDARLAGAPAGGLEQQEALARQPAADPPAAVHVHEPVQRRDQREQPADVGEAGQL